MGEPRGSKVVSHSAKRVRAAMVDNLGRLIAREYPRLTPTAAYELIGEATGLSLSTFQRIMSGKTGPSIDTLANIAWHLGSSVAEVLAVEAEQQSAKSPFKKSRSDIQDQSNRG